MNGNMTQVTMCLTILDLEPLNGSTNPFHVRWVEPLAGNEAALDLNLSFEPHRKNALLAARDSQTFTITKPIDLVQGGKGFLAYFPLYNQQSEFEGFILGVFDINALVSSHLPSQFHLEYELTLKESDNLIFKNTDNIETSKRRKFVSTSIKYARYHLDLLHPAH